LAIGYESYPEVDNHRVLESLLQMVEMMIPRLSKERKSRGTLTWTGLEKLAPGPQPKQLQFHWEIGSYLHFRFQSTNAYLLIYNP